MGFVMPERPRFLERSLQGLAYWIGHRKSMFWSWPLSEGALVAEACTLIQANLPDAQMLRPECQYEHLVYYPSRFAGVNKRARADLSILSKSAASTKRSERVAQHVEYVIEIKRAAAPKSEIDKDLQRLYSLLVASRQRVRAFLIVVSESKAPTRFVKGGRSKLGQHPIPGRPGFFHVRRTVKAAASFSNVKSAHFVCLVEVFHKKPRIMPPL